MKTFLTQLLIVCAIGLSIALFSGCTTVDGEPVIDKEQACLAASTAYAIYLAVINADGKPSQDQIAAAQAAAIVLETMCGWTAPPAEETPAPEPATRAAKLPPKPAKPVDAYGVPILLPPAA
jgi:hypothetical protein